MNRFLYSPNDYSPTYDIESNNRRFVKLHAIWDIPPDYPKAKRIDPIDQHYIDYISGVGWEKLLEHRDSLGQET